MDVGRLSAILIMKGIELQLAVTLWQSYGDVRTALELWQRFCSQPELSRIGTVTSLVVLAALFYVSNRAIISMLTKRREPGPCDA